MKTDNYHISGSLKLEYFISSAITTKKPNGYILRMPNGRPGVQSPACNSVFFNTKVQC